jgi:predicted Zn-dependent peptidase
MTLVVATSLEPSVVQDLAFRHLGHLPPGDSPPPLDAIESVERRLRATLPAGDPVPPEIAGVSLPDSTVLRVRKVGGRQASLTLVRSLGTIPRGDLHTLEVWNATLSSEIQFQLREREGLAYSIGSSVERLPDGTTLWIASAGSGTKNLGRILSGFEEAFERALDTPPDSAEVRKQGAQLYGRSLMRRATRMNRAYAAGAAILAGEDPLKIDEEIRMPTLVTPAMVDALRLALRGGGPSLVAIAY